MGRAALLAFPAFGHVTPALAVAAQLVRRGEEVHAFAAERSRDAATRAGARFHPYAVPYERFDPTPPTAGLFADMPRLLDVTETLLPGLIDELRALAPDYLLLDSKSVWGRLAGAVLGIPAVTLSVVFAIRPGVIPVSALVRLLYGNAPEPALLAGLKGFTAYTATAARLRRAYGVAVPDLIEYLGNPQPLTIVFTSRLLQPDDVSFDEERYRFVGTSIAPEREQEGDFPFAQLDAPVVYISLGTTFNDAPAFYAACFEAFGDAPWRIVLATGRGGEVLPPAPANFIVRPFVPQLGVLRRTRVFVTHGGMNSANEALALGVPLVVVPQRGDQHLVATRVAELGAGVWIGPGEVTAPRLRAAVESLIRDPAFTQRAQAVGTTIRAGGGAMRAADDILRHVAGVRLAHGV